MRSTGGDHLSCSVVLSARATGKRIRPMIGKIKKHLLNWSYFLLAKQIPIYFVFSDFFTVFKGAGKSNESRELQKRRDIKVKS